MGFSKLIIPPEDIPLDVLRRSLDPNISIVSDPSREGINGLDPVGLPMYFSAMTVILWICTERNTVRELENSRGRDGGKCRHFSKV